MSYARLDYLQCLMLIIKTMSTNPVWLIFHRHDLILEKERKKKKKKMQKLGNSLHRSVFRTQSIIYDGIFLQN